MLGSESQTYVLHGDEVRLDQGHVVCRLEEADNTGMVDTRDQDGEQVVEQCRLLSEIEVEGLVVAATMSDHSTNSRTKDEHLNVSHANDGLLEHVVLPSIRRALNHGQRSVVL